MADLSALTTACDADDADDIEGTYPISLDRVNHMHRRLIALRERLNYIMRAFPSTEGRFVIDDVLTIFSTLIGSKVRDSYPCDLTSKVRRLAADVVIDCERICKLISEFDRPRYVKLKKQHELLLPIAKQTVGNTITESEVSQNKSNSETASPCESELRAIELRSTWDYSFHFPSPLATTLTRLRIADLKTLQTWRCNSGDQHSLSQYVIDWNLMTISKMLLKLEDKMGYTRVDKGLVAEYSEIMPLLVRYSSIKPLKPTQRVKRL